MNPIPIVRFDQEGKPPKPVLLVFLPGRGDNGARFDTEGFVSAARRAGIPADMIAVDAHMGYYLERNLPEKLYRDVITPARLRGYRHIWLVGISMGGLGALWYDIGHPGDLAGIVILAPYLGDPEVVAEVVRAGGMSAWQPADAVPDDQRKIWKGLKVYEDREKSRGRVFLGYGRQDRFAEANGLLAAVLPPEQVFLIDGGHDWETWKDLWARILRRLPLNGGDRQRPLLE
jgi:pimeloyl-ACP methyl ester carboxylesterase